MILVGRLLFTWLFVLVSWFDLPLIAVLLWVLGCGCGDVCWFLWLVWVGLVVLVWSMNSICFGLYGFSLFDFGFVFAFWGGFWELVVVFGAGGSFGCLFGCLLALVFIAGLVVCFEFWFDFIVVCFDLIWT